MYLNTIEWKKKAVKELQKIPLNERKTVYEAVSSLVNFPDVQNIKRLVNHRFYEYRLRVGNYRVLFNYAKKIQVISIEEVKKRDERTY